uniref:Glycosyl hydrolase family 13 catalytic domain-containing protein n=1 Tax=Romanomermis culicivorax TaxID=13658 RepID=A0A915KKS3_ROMCU
IRVVIDFPIAAVDTYHKWFQTGASTFSDYFLWIKNKTMIEENRTVDCEKGRCFKSTPDDHGAVLNWHYEPLRRALLEEVIFWVDHNVDGVHLTSVEHLIRRKHYKTGDLEKISGYLKEFIFQLKHRAQDRELFVCTSLDRSSTKNLTVDEFEDKLKPESSGFDAILRDTLFFIDQECRSFCLRGILEKSIGTRIGSHRLYTLGGPDVEHLADRLGEEMAQMFNLLFLSLPGSVIIYYGDEIGLLDHSRILFVMMVSQSSVTMPDFSLWRQYFYT